MLRILSKLFPFHLMMTSELFRLLLAADTLLRELRDVILLRSDLLQEPLVGCLDAAHRFHQFLISVSLLHHLLV